MEDKNHLWQLVGANYSGIETPERGVPIMGMEALGRLFNVAPIASGAAQSLKTCTAMTFVCTGNDTFTLTVSATFGGSYVAPPTTAIGGGLIRVKYTNPQTNGTGVFTQVRLASGSYANTATISSGIVVFAIYPVDLAPSTSGGGGTNYAYVKCTAGGSGLVTAVAHDLTEQRSPQNLPALSA